MLFYRIHPKAPTREVSRPGVGVKARDGEAFEAGQSSETDSDWADSLFLCVISASYQCKPKAVAR